MTISLDNPFLQLVINPQDSRWSVYDVQENGPSLEDIWMRVSYQRRLVDKIPLLKSKCQVLEFWDNPRISAVSHVLSRHGPQKQVLIDVGPDTNGILCQLDFRLVMDSPCFLWRLRLKNCGQHSIEINKVEMLRAGFLPKHKLITLPGLKTSQDQRTHFGYGAVRPSQSVGKLGFFSNGWQSWSYSGFFAEKDKPVSSRFGFLASQLWFSGGKAPRRYQGEFSSDMFGVIGDRTHRTGILIGFLSQRMNFGSLEAFIADRLSPAVKLLADGDQVLLQPGKSTSTDWAVIQFVNLDDPDPLKPYLDAVTRQNEISTARLDRSPIVGWCSWYQFFGDIDEEKIKSNLISAENLKNKIPLSVLQVDDGFQAQVGDFYEFSAGFPNGISPLAERIRDAGFIPGLWLAPFILHPASKTARSHPKWQTRNFCGLPVNAGFQWNIFARALDLSQAEVLEHVKDLIHTAVKKWGFSYLKLDFLCAAALKGKYADRTKTRAQILHNSLIAIREAAGEDAILVGCGVPLGSSIGVFDAMRIGADVAPYWDPQLFSLRKGFQQETGLPSVRNALNNVLSRSVFHNRWWINDPDCLIIRPDSALTLAEVQTQATVIALSGGTLMLSDDLPKIPEERLRMIEQLLPPIGRRPRVLDWFDSSPPKMLRLDLNNRFKHWHLLSIVNWSDEDLSCKLSLAAIDLPQGDYFSREFWSGEVDRVSGGYISINGIPPHGVCLVALTPITASMGQKGINLPCYLGGNLHISQGLEVAEWDLFSDHKLLLRFDRPEKTRGAFDLFLPGEPKEVTTEVGDIHWERIGQDIYRFQGDLYPNKGIIISW